MINRKLAISNIILISLCLVFIMLITVNSTMQLFYKESVTIYDQIINEKYEVIEDYLEKMRDDCVTVSVNSSLVQLFSSESFPDTQKYEELIDSLQSYLYPETVNIYYVQNDNIYIYNTNSHFWNSTDYSLLDFDYGHDFRYQFRNMNRDVVALSRLMFASDNKTVIGVVNVELPLTSFSTMFYTFNPFEDYKSHLYLLDENNNCLIPFHIRENIVITETNHIDSLTSSDFSLKNERIQVVKNIRYCNWKMVAVLQNSSLLQGYSKTLRTIIASVAVIEFLTIIISIALTNRITKPVLSLADEVLKSAENDKFEKLDTPENASGEVLVLYNNYNYLIDEVNRAIVNIQEISRKEADNQFMLLQAQINPHFLYNTLNAISFMAQNGQNEDIEKMVVSLVTMFRNSLNNGEPFIQLSGEIDHVSSYLQIMQFRYPDRYTVEYDLAENTLDLMVTKQILQPLAENALTHGFLEKQLKGTITIRSYIRDEYLVLEMINTGAEIDLDLVDRILKGDPELISKHYGIRNVNSRLITYYGDECGLKYRTENGNTIVSMQLPLEKLRG